MNKKTKPPTNSLSLSISSIILYVGVIVVFALNLFNINADFYSLVFAIALFVAGLPLAYAIARKIKNRVLMAASVVGVSIVIGFPLLVLGVV